MKIRYHRIFNKAFIKLSPKIRKKVKETIVSFQKDPHNPDLDNHPLHGKLKGKCSISIGGDLRIIFVEKNNYEIAEFFDVGTHNQVYK